jgi:hypothetical protein
MSKVEPRAQGASWGHDLPEVLTLAGFAPRFVDGHARAMGCHDFEEYERLLIVARRYSGHAIVENRKRLMGMN